MSILYALVGFALFCIWVLTIVDIVRRHLGAGKTAAWILLVVIVPFVGAILYWVLRKPSQEEIDRQVEAQSDIRSGRNPSGMIR